MCTTRRACTEVAQACSATQNYAWQMICMPYHVSMLFETADYSTMLMKLGGA